MQPAVLNKYKLYFYLFFPLQPFGTEVLRHSPAPPDTILQSPARRAAAPGSGVTGARGTGGCHHPSPQPQALPPDTAASPSAAGAPHGAAIPSSSPIPSEPLTPPRAPHSHTPL